MKIQSLIIHNIGLIADETIPLNKPLIIFYGQIRQGKTTILNCVRWVCGGAFPSDIIKHGEKEAFIELPFDGGSIRREWYVARDGSTKARDVVFVRDGKPVPNPVNELKKFLNPFLLNQDHLRDMGETERKKYFTDLFGVDTKALDVEAFNADREASNLRATIKGYGQIDLTKVEAVDIAAAQTKLAEVRNAYATQKRELEGQLSQMSLKHQSECEAVEDDNDAIRRHNASVERAENQKLDIAGAIEAHKQKIVELEKQLAAIVVQEKKPLKARPANPDYTKIQKKILDLQPDTSALEKQIQDAGATNVRAEQYQANLKRDQQRQADEKKLTALETRLREIKKEKIAMLSTISAESGIECLEFDENGNFTYQGTQAGMLSTSQVMRLSSELSSLYPDGFGVELLDRGESLGTSIFDLIQRAKFEEKTILATVVGEKPATVPKDIGVFVVKDGKLES